MDLRLCSSDVLLLNLKGKDIAYGVEFSTGWVGPTNPTGPAGSGRKYNQMTRVGSDLGLNLFRSVKKHLLIIAAVHRKESLAAACNMHHDEGRGQT